MMQIGQFKRKRSRLSAPFDGLFFLLLLKFFLAGGNDLLRDVCGNHFVVIEFHGEVTAAAGNGAQLGGVAQHFRLRDRGGDGGMAFFGFHALHACPAGVQVAQDIAHVDFGHNDLDQP